jgi:predicted Mrr-cat superfamily restriction endonuclease
VALLKIIVRESHLDTNTTTNQICTKLSNLDSYILTVDSNIGKFNQYVKLLVQSLTARNQKTSDLLINLFKGYGAVRDERRSLKGLAHEEARQPQRRRGTHTRRIDERAHGMRRQLKKR